MGIAGVTNETAAQGYQLYKGVYEAALNQGANKETARKTTIIFAITTQDKSPGVKYTEAEANALYNVYEAASDNKAETVPTEDDVKMALATQGIPEAVAKAFW